MKFVIQPVLLLLFMLVVVSCSKSGGNTPVTPVRNPPDTTVVTPPKDTTTAPPKDTTTTPPKDTTGTGTTGYKYVLTGISSGLVLDLKGDSTVVEVSNGINTGVDAQSWDGAKTMTAELHTKSDMIVTQSGSNQFCGWSDVLQKSDVTDVQWSDTTSHPYIKETFADTKTILIGLFVEDATVEAGKLTFRSDSGTNANNAVVKETVAKNGLHVTRYIIP